MDTDITSLCERTSKPAMLFTLIGMLQNTFMHSGTILHGSYHSDAFYNLFHLGMCII